jgi:hypothetical protein
MKKILFASAIAAAAFASSTAFAQVTGYGGVAVNWGQVQVSGAEDNFSGVTASGAVLAPVGAGLAVQADAAYVDSADMDGALSGAVHLIGNVGEDMRVGAFVSASEVDNETALGGGFEGQAQFDNSTLAATIGYAKVDEFDVSGWGVNGEYRYFFTDNVRVDGSLGWASFDTPLGDTEAWAAGLGAEFKQANSPLSVFGGWSYTEANELDVAANTFTLGLRYNFGGSLKERDRSGPSFDGANGILSLANF